MKKIIGAIIAIVIIGSIIYFQKDKNNIYPLSSSTSFEQRLQSYIEKNFSNGYSCNNTTEGKYFFDFIVFTYQNSWEYLVSLNSKMYGLTSLGNITLCGWWWDTLIIKDNENNFSLVHKFAMFEFEEKIPQDILKLLKTKEIKNTAYEQAKKYFKIEENKKISQECPKDLCNKTWYQLLEDGDKDNTNDNIFVYSTTPPKEMENAWKRWTLNFVDNNDMTEIDRSCPNNENDWRCPNITRWKIINKNTISYPLTGDPDRENRIELIEVSKDTLKYVHLYD